MKIPTTLVIMDGYGLAEQCAVSASAICAANTPYLDSLFAQNPTTRLVASGEDVGLPEGQQGNSEVGHVNIGAGRVVYQDLPRVTAAIRDGSLFENPALKAAMEAAKANGGALHLMGLLSDGGVHSHITHIWALLEMAKREGLTKVYLHGFLDGRDVSPTSGTGYIRAAEETCREIGVGKIATVMGRYWAMDRDKRWDRVEMAYNAMVFGEGIHDPDPALAVERSYAEDVTDEFVRPVVCDPEGLVKAGDAVIFFNFRPDRAREITRAFVDCDFDGFVRGGGRPGAVVPTGLHYVCLTQYDEEMPNVTVAFPPQEITETFGEYIASLGKTQLRIAETEKYAHVTFFFNGGVEEPYPGEDRVLIPSPKAFATYDLVPEMSAYQVAEACVARIQSGAYDVIILNFANCDMVGHTGDFAEVVKAVEVVDACVKQVVEATVDMGGVALITSDHGNAEYMREPCGSPATAHTTNPVPLAIVGVDVALKEGRLADIAPTMLELMGLQQPKEMTGESLIVKS